MTWRELIILTAVLAGCVGGADVVLAQAADEVADCGGCASDAESMAETVLFYVVGGIAALTALGCVLSVNVVRMAVCLFGTLGAMAILYFLMGADFLGAIQLIVYAGGTLVVIVFGVMLTTQTAWSRFVPTRGEIVAGATLCGVLFVVLAVVLLRAEWATAANGDSFPVETIGQALLTTYLVPFEAVSVLLLAVMIGAAYLARRERE